MTDVVSRYVRFIFDEYEKDPRGWITKHPPSVAEFVREWDVTYHPFEGCCG